MPTTAEVNTAAQNFIDDTVTADSKINGAAGTVTDRYGNTTDNLEKIFSNVGYYAPVDFVSGLTVDTGAFSVTYGGKLYAAEPSEVPFTTTTTFDASQWRVISFANSYNPEDFGGGIAGINDAIAAAAADGGGRVYCNFDFDLTETLVAGSGVTLEFQGVTVTATTSLTAAVDFGATVGFSVTGTVTWNLGGFVTDCYRMDGAKNWRIGGGCTINGWIEAIVGFSTATTALENGIVEDGVVLGVPHTADVVYPVLFSSRPGISGLTAKNIHVGNIRIEDTVAGAYSAANQQTADQIVFQDVDGFSVGMLGGGPAISKNGGENGFAASWGARNGVVNIHAEANDAHGINVGAGSIPLTVSSVVGTFVTGETVTVTGGYTAVVHSIPSATRLNVTGATGGLWDQTETLTLTGGTSGATCTIDAAPMTENVVITPLSQSIGNGLDVAVSGGSLAGHYAQQARRIVFDGLVQDNPTALIANNSTYSYGPNLAFVGNTAQFSGNALSEFLGAVRDDYLSAGPLIDLHDDGRIVIGTTQLSAPLLASGNSTDNNGMAIDTAGRVQMAGNANPALRINQTGTATTKYKHALGILMDAVDVGGLGTAGLELPTFTVATLLAAGSWTGYVVRVSDGSGGNPTLAMSDGTDWIDLISGEAVSTAPSSTEVLLMRSTDSSAVNASTTLVSDDTLTRAVEANSVYGFKIKLRYSSSAAAGLDVGMDVPAGASGDWVIPNTSSNVLVDIGTVITGTGHNTINRNMVIEGTVITGGTAGSMTLQFAQNASDASDTQLLAGSTLRVWKG
ncbi:MAG: hypothetical protein GOVbin4933_80 [Prokaryotic dsDNA virus sp.]|nr:MAG: hypothetical protein GOVbin4933_80 [Prokaryotic dsDNA virus sp.]